MRNREITEIGNLLNRDGTLANPGWSRSLVQNYRRKDIKANKMRIKEWDYYLILNDDFAIALTVADNAYMGLQSVSVMDFTKPSQITKTNTNLMPMGSMNMPESSKYGDVIYGDKKVSMHFIKSDGKRKLVCYYPKYHNEKPFYCNIELDEPEMDSIVIATPWKENEKAFYYNQKINCMKASGEFIYDGKKYEFKKENSYGTLDWGRGVWTYDNTWYWGSGNGTVEGKPFGFNIGYGFGDTSAATENIIFYDGVGHKLDDVTIYFDKTNYMTPWIIRSSDKRFEMEFEPIIDRNAKTDIKVLVSDQHQIFGKISGKAVLDDGKVLNIKDLTCFIEEVRNKY